MFKLVVLSVLVATAMAAPAPGLLHGAPLAYSTHVAHAPAVAIPTAISHQSRVDVHHAPLLATTYTAHVAPAVHAAPLVHAVPAVHAVAPVAIHSPALSAAVTHQARYAVHPHGIHLTHGW